MPAQTHDLMPAAAVFDAVAERFDTRFGPWLSVSAQRRAVRRALAQAFPTSARLLEIGGGTGEDAAWLTARGRHVLLTDPSPTMVAMAGRKIGRDHVMVLAAEQLDRLADEGKRFDGAYSNFAALNCVADLAPVGESLARLVRPGGKAMLVVFGRVSPGEMVVEMARGRLRNVLRRFRRTAAATLVGRPFTVSYHRGRDIRGALTPWFRPVERRAIGLFVPPSAAEPWISRFPQLVALMEKADRLFERPFFFLGDHVLYVFERRFDVGSPE